ncbi:MAG TPA: Hsp20/alpha crystallin family protein, partial [Methanospirillum sp.]|nr:Hsp20/alpha crystallin family protein [Methanospirillum sp.]
IRTNLKFVRRDQNMTLFKRNKGTEIIPAAQGNPDDVRRSGSVFFENFDSIFDDFRRSFDSLMMPYFPAEFSPWDLSDRRKTSYAPLDLIDEGDHYRIQVELPGMTKEDVEVNITLAGISIRAHKDEKSESQEKNYLHRERYYSSWKRDIRFPEEVNPERAEGTMKDGILQLSIPKREPKPKEMSHRINLK